MNIDRWKQSGCYVTTVLIVINVAVFVCMVLQSSGSQVIVQSGRIQETGRRLMDYGAMITGAEHEGEWYRLVTSMFLHFDLEHLGNNMLMLAVMGSILEKPIGSFSFAVIYFVGGICGNVVSAYYYGITGANAISAGASGAVMAVSGAFLFLELVGRKHMGTAISLPRIAIFAVLMAAQCVSQQGVNNYAHLGGLVSGFLLGALFWCFIGRRRMMRLSWQSQQSYGEGNDIDYED